MHLWKLHFQDILNENEHESLMYDNNFKHQIEDNICDLKHRMNKYDSPTPIDLSPYTFQEIKLMCESLPPGKSPGKDNVSYEHFKYVGTHFISLNLSG